MKRLTRSLSLFSATNVVVADMVGAGIFTTSGLVLAELGEPMWMLGLWAAGGVLALCGAVVYGALGAAMPEAGGEYVYLSQLFHPMLGFLSGWVSFFVGFSAPLAASAIGFSEYLTGAFPHADLLAESGQVKRLIAVGIIVLLTLVHVHGLRLGARVQNALTVGKVVLILLLVGIGLGFGKGDVSFLFDSLEGTEGVGLRKLGLSLMWITFAYSGWNASGYIGSEIKEPRRNLPLSLLAGTAIVLGLYLLMNVAFVYGAGAEALSGQIAVGSIAAERLFGPAAQSVVSVTIAFALLSSLGALVILGPRVYYAMARDGRFFSFAGEIHERYGVPSKSILLQGLIAALLALTGTFDQILTYMGFCLGIFPILAVLGVFRLPSRQVALPRALLMPCALLFAAISAGVLTLAYAERPIESTVAVLTILVGVPAYYIFRRRTAVALRRAGLGATTGEGADRS